jgi:hypothetical protein
LYLDFKAFSIKLSCHFRDSSPNILAISFL